MGTPLMWIFDIKKEERIRNDHLVIISHSIGSFALPVHSSVLRNLSIRILLLITEDRNLNTAIGDAVNAFINTNVG